MDRFADAPVWRQLLDVERLEIYLAGGSLRDMFLGRDVVAHDMDFFLGGSGTDRALEVLAQAGRLDRGPFGSPRWFPATAPEHYCDVVPIARFFNGLWHCEDIVDVLNQFDFTANAVAIDLRDGVLHDPQNGRRDIARKTLRAVRFDYPEEPIAPGCELSRHTVLWFRLLHYAAHLGFTLEPLTLKWLRARRDLERYAEGFQQRFFALHRDWSLPLDGPSDG